MRQKEIVKAVQQGFTHAEPQTPPPASVASPAEDTGGSKHDLELARPTPELNPRNIAMKEIAERANREADASAAESIPVTDDEGNIVEPAKQSEPAQAAEPQQEEVLQEAPQEAQPAAATPQAQPEAAPAGKPAIDPNADYEIQVDGALVTIKGSKILSQVQKDSAADYRLQLATQTLEAARRQAEAIAKPIPQGTAAAPAAPAVTPESTLSDEKLAEMLQFGGQEQAAKAIAELRKRSAPAVTLEDVKRLLAEETPRITSHEMAFQEATRFAKTEYADLLADPYLARLFYTEEDRLRQAGNIKPYDELYREIGDGLRKHFNRPKPTGATPPAASPTRQAAAAPVPTVAQRQAAKAAAPAAPRLASARLEGGGQEQKPKTREEIIKQMQESRGQRPVARQQ